MNQIEIFNNEEFGKVRILKDGDTYLFCGTDVTAALGYQNSRAAIQRHCKGVTKRDTLTEGGKQALLFISEGDVYRLIVHSKLPSAQHFEMWIFDEIMPFIRKHGAYMTPEKVRKVVSSPEAILGICRELISEHERNHALKAENANLREKAQYFDIFVDTEYCTNIRITAKELQVPEHKFVRFLLNRKYVYRSASGVILPYAVPKNKALFQVKDYCWSGHPGAYMLITPQGKRTFFLMRKEILETI